MQKNSETVPNISKTAFCCPHCNAYTSQDWSKLFTKSYPTNQRFPFIPNQENKAIVLANSDLEDAEKADLIELIEKTLTGKPFFNYKKDGYPSYSSNVLLRNMNISKCYNCKEISVWVHTRMVWPSMKIEIQSNQDLPPHITSLFEEARVIVSDSPKGAAALLRLSIQYLCKELGEDGKNIDKDIASLVSKGLNPLVQQALDVVRVIGNEAVHPGEINLDDNKDIALKLFDLVNIIADEMISRPKQVQALYDGLPESKLKGIKSRDLKATGLEKKS